LNFIDGSFKLLGKLVDLDLGLCELFSEGFVGFKLGLDFFLETAVQVVQFVDAVLEVVDLLAVGLDLCLHLIEFLFVSLLD
jgi:hypothetical protein